MCILRVSAIAAAALVLSGCADLLEGPRQLVSVDSAPIEGADCTLTNALGTWYVFTPGRVSVTKSRTDLNVVCAKQGYRPAHMAVTSHGTPETVNVFAGDEPGLRNDVLSGANFHYDSPIVVRFEQPNAVPAHL
jgi:hypothetical protein